MAESKPASSSKGPSVFLSHAGEQKKDYASILHTLLTQSAGIDTFLDVKGLKWADEQKPTFKAAIQSAGVVVLILSPDFVCKKWPMWELQTALALKKTLLPILVEGMVIEDLGHLEERVYSKDETWQGKVYSKPDTKVLQEWAKTGAAVKTIVALQHVSSEQVQGFLGDLAEAVVDRCVDILKDQGRLLPGYARKDPRMLPIFLNIDRSKQVVGRSQEQQQIREGLTGEQRHVVITGGPGEGKTTLARFVVKQMFEEGYFPAGVFEVDLTGVGGDAKEAVAAALVPRLKTVLGNAIPATADPVWATLEPWLRTGTQPLLLLLDNGEELIKSYRGAEEAEEALCELADVLCVSSKHIHIILTTRPRTISLCPHHPCSVCHLETMAVDEAVELLQQLVPNRGFGPGMADESTGRQLVEACGRNPLELELVGGLIKMGRCSPQLVLEVGRGASAAEAATSARGINTGNPYGRHVRRLVRWWRELLSLMLSGSKLIKVAALSVFGGSFDEQGAMAIAATVGQGEEDDAGPMDEYFLELVTHLSVLSNASSSTGLPGRFAMHHLHREAAALVMADHRAAVEAAFCTWMLHLGDRLGEAWEQLRGYSGPGAGAENTQDPAWLLSAKLPGAEAANIRELLRLLQQQGPRHPSERKKVGRSLGSIAVQLSKRGYFAMATPLLRAELQIWEETDELHWKARALVNLGAAAHAQGRLPDAEQLCTEAFYIYMQLHGKEGGIPDGMITCISNLAAFKCAKGQLREAWELSEMAHRYSRKIDAASGDQVSLTTVNAAIHAATALQHQARLHEAQEVFNRALADLRELREPPSIDSASAWRGLALSYSRCAQLNGSWERRLQNLRQAEECFQAAESVCFEMWGQDDADKHMLTAEVWDGLAAVKLHQGILEGSGPTLQKAVALYQKALQCKQAKRGRAHPETAATVNNLAILFKRIGEYSQAELLFKEAAAVFRSHRASCEPFLANAEDELGGMLVALGRCEEAVPLLQDALQIRTRTFPTGHPARLTTQAQLQEALRRAAAGPVAGVASVGASSVSRSADASAPPRSRGGQDQDRPNANSIRSTAGVQAPSSHGQVGEQQEQQQHQGKQKDAASSSSTQGAASDGRASDQRSVEHVEGSLSSRRAEGGRQAPAGQAAPPPALAPEDPPPAKHPALGPEEAKAEELDRAWKKMRGVLEDMKKAAPGGEEQFKTAVTTLLKYIANITTKPAEERFRSINTSNPAFQARVAAVPGGTDFLQLCGFQLKEGLLVMGADQVDTDQLNAALVELSNVITNPSSGIL